MTTPAEDGSPAASEETSVAGILARVVGGPEPCEGRCGRRVTLLEVVALGPKGRLLVEGVDRDERMILVEHTPARCRALRAAC